MKFEKFSIVIYKVFDVRVKLHWTILLSLAFFSGFKFELFYCLAFFALIFIHEMGHALMVKLLSFENNELIVHGAGGACVWSGPATQRQIYTIAWGGILAQLVIFILFVLLSETLNLDKNAFIDQIFRAFIGTNLVLLIFNLLPIAPLDGAQAWKIFRPMWSNIRSMKNRQKYKQSNEIIQQQIKQIFEENEGTTNNSQRTRSTRRRS